MSIFNSISPAGAQPDSLSTTPTKRRKKRNRALERLRRKIIRFQEDLYAKGEALHAHADHLQEDDPEARFDSRIPTTSVHRIRAREKELIGHLMWHLLN